MKNHTQRPLIGIVVCGIEQHKQFVSDAYITAIRYAGGLPVLIPFIRSSSIMARYTSLCDGFLFCGGNDISPLLFGQQPLTDVGSTNLTFDFFQIRLMQMILKTQKPLLAICRGMQVLNTSLGGSIWQDLSLCPKQRPGRSQNRAALNHMQLSSSREDPSHLITIKRKSKLHKILGCTRIYTNSYHHQAVNHLGKGLIAAAHSTDHIIEAIELSHHPFAIGVQWHPECMVSTTKQMQHLFLSFLRLS